MNKYHLVAIILSLLVFGVFYYGATQYHYLEDDDSWGHLMSAKYIYFEKTILNNHDFRLKYIDPYPPLYDVLMATLHIFYDSMFFTLKFYNAVLCGLAIYFFFLFAKVFMKDEKKAVVATFIIAMLPSFMSHFIWSQTLAIVLMMMGFWALASKKYWLVSISTALILVTQPSCAFVFILMVGVYIIFKKNPTYLVKKETPISTKK